MRRPIEVGDILRLKSGWRIERYGAWARVMMISESTGPLPRCIKIVWYSLETENGSSMVWTKGSVKLNCWAVDVLHPKQVLPKEPHGNNMPRGW